MVLPEWGVPRGGIANLAAWHTLPRAVEPVSMPTRARVTTTLPALAPDAFPGFGEDAPLDLPPLSVGDGGAGPGALVAGDFDAWPEALARVGNCSGSIRLRGRFGTQR